MRAALLLSLALTLSGCPLSVYHVNRLPDSQPLAEPVLFNRPGPLVAEATGFEFSEQYGCFQRVTAYRYDSAGVHVSLGYNDRSNDCLVVATVYVYPTPRLTILGSPPDAIASIERSWLEQEFARTAAELERHHPAMHSVDTSPVTTPAAMAALDGTSLRFREADSTSELRLFVYDHQWFLKYRFTYPEACASDARSRLEALVAQLPWAQEP